MATSVLSGCRERDRESERLAMKIEYDKQVDALYIRIQEEGVARTQELSDCINLDFDDQGRLIGLEVLSASKRYASADLFNLSTENLILP
jgi:uncharacterized protein YuzE